MGSSISLTLWAFLGMESAAQNSSAVENPKRDVPLACLFGTLGAAVIYVLSTTVIQGIVPNAELADSTGPFGLAYEYMFNPTVGKIIMAPRRDSPVSDRSWAGNSRWHRPAKSAAEERMFPSFFSKVNRMGRADHRHDRARRRPDAACPVDHFSDAQRAVQRARQPGGRHERHSLRRRAVVARNHDEEGESARRASIASTSSSPWSPWDTACSRSTPRAWKP